MPGTRCGLAGLMASPHAVALFMLGAGLSGLGSDGYVEGVKNVELRGMDWIDEGGTLSARLSYDA